ncbi:AAA family ATPase [Glycomyces harbinensis]|uniref:Type VII secretion AAA-ATPase EccA n=1 Tax=Glycomyces harbinensis TaxID=58114 RepID=A0A1G7AQL2_9ACTN|nr:AAA family ATPase [Glycomyces harbinensis]SDE17081.1 type VII secretion AAA-ATPase EccA [Glycomyces harbinensis]
MSFSTATESASAVWSRGVGLLDDGDLVRASDCFEHVLEYDPRAADAWLGLHACGERQDEALLRMLEHRDQLGRLRKTTGLALKSKYFIGQFVDYTLSDVYDAWLAHVAGLLDAGQGDRAAKALATADDQDHDEDDRIRFLRARLPFVRGEWSEVLDAAQNIATPSLHDEAQFYVAASLMRMNAHGEAFKVIEGLPTGKSAPHFDAHLSFLRGTALESLGEGATAAQAFQRAYRLAPDVEEFAERADAVHLPRTMETTDVRPSRPTDSGDARGTGGRAGLLAVAARELDAMIGLKPVKDQINTLKAQFRMAALKEERGIKTASRPQHFVFAGPPGTGKTTVARIMGEILAGLGLLEHGKVVETQRGDLVAGYLGQTATKTREKIEEATGGILFIDEAYSLANEGYDGYADVFGDEAMQEILTAAENRRDRLVIVLAGYTDEMQQLLSTNPGLKSRFSTVIEFPSYSAEELVAIAVSFLSAAGESLSAEAERSLRAGCEIVVDSGQIDALGNGRFVRQLCGKAAGQRDLRLLRHYGDSGMPTTAEMTTIEAVDIANAHEELAA